MLYEFKSFPRLATGQGPLFIVANESRCRKQLWDARRSHRTGRNAVPSVWFPKRFRPDKILTRPSLCWRHTEFMTILFFSDTCSCRRHGLFIEKRTQSCGFSPFSPGSAIRPNPRGAAENWVKRGTSAAALLVWKRINAEARNSIKSSSRIYKKSPALS